MGRTIEISEEAYQALAQRSEKERKSRKEIASFILIGALKSKEESYSLNMKRTIKISEKAYQALSHQSEKEGKSREEIASFILISALGSEEEKTPVLGNNKEKK